MNIDYLTGTFAAQYSDLVTGLLEQKATRPEMPSGTIAAKQVDGAKHWYVQYVELTKRRQVYIGPDNDETTDTLDRLRSAWREQNEDRQASARLVSAVLASGIVTFDAATARVLDVLDEQGVFQAGVTLVGTNAFLAYQGLLGVRWTSAARTADIDIASDLDIVLASPADLVGALDATGLPFHAVPSLAADAPSTSFKVRRKELRVDILVPLIGKPTSGAVRVPGLKVYGVPMRYLDYLIEKPTDVALPCRRGLLVPIPSPARFAVHKLIVSQKRPAFEHNKRTKDIAQAGQLFTVLADARPGDISDAWEDAARRGKGWRTPLHKGASLLPEAVGSELRRIGIDL
jgi:hypothetical protein